MSKDPKLSYGQAWEERFDGLVTSVLGPDGKYQAVKSMVKSFLLMFFKDIRERGAHQVPKTGPVFFVCAPHANQFIDPSIIMAFAPRNVGYIAAKVSLDNVKAVGLLGRAMEAIPVMRPQDYAITGKGHIYVDPNDAKIIRGVGTQFTKEVKPRCLLSTPNKESVEVVEIVSDTEVKVKAPFSDLGAPFVTLNDENLKLVKNGSLPNIPPPAPPSSKPRRRKRDMLTAIFGRGGKTVGKKKEAPQPTGYGSVYKITPHLDQSIVYQATDDRLHAGKCVGIFPEGGSHDQPELLPLKAGVIIMTLSAMASDPNCDVKLVPVGLHYFHRDRFRSRAAVEFGRPINVPKEAVEDYKAGGERKRKAISSLLEQVSDGLKQVTVNAKDYDTLNDIQTMRRLVKPTGKTLTEHENLELTRRLIAGYTQMKDEAKLKEFIQRCRAYNTKLEQFGLHDHMVKDTVIGGTESLKLLLTRLGELFVASLLVLPGALTTGPAFYFAQKMAHDKAKKAKEASSVKIWGRDIIATWKIIYTLAMLPFIYLVDTLVIFLFLKFWRGWSWLSFLWVSPLIFISLFPIGWWSVRLTEQGAEWLASLKPLTMSLFNLGATHELRQERAELQARGYELIEEFGPMVVKDFDKNRIIAPTERGYNQYVSSRVSSGRRASLAYDSWASTNVLREEARQELQDGPEPEPQPFAISLDEPVDDFKLFGASDAFDFSKNAHQSDDESDDEDSAAGSKKND